MSDTTRNQDQIEPGDIVSINFETVRSLHQVTVLYVPCATGDSWRVRDQEGTLHYIGSFCLMTMVKKKE
jgi:hypothetical protein